MGGSRLNRQRPRSGWHGRVGRWERTDGGQPRMPARRRADLRGDTAATCSAEASMRPQPVRSLGPIPLIRGDVDVAKLMGEFDVDRVLLASSVGSLGKRSDLVCELSQLAIHLDVVPGWGEVMGSRLELHEMEGMAAAHLSFRPSVPVVAFAQAHARPGRCGLRPRHLLPGAGRLCPCHQARHPGPRALPPAPSRQGQSSLRAAQVSLDERECRGAQGADRRPHDPRWRHRARTVQGRRGPRDEMLSQELFETQVLVGRQPCSPPRGSPRGEDELSTDRPPGLSAPLQVRRP